MTRHYKPQLKESIYWVNKLNQRVQSYLLQSPYNNEVDIGKLYQNSIQTLST
jgi:hypothetical protein